MRYRLYIYLIIAVLALSACSNTKFLADDQLLYTGKGKTEIVPTEPEVKASKVSGEVRSVSSHKMNNGFLGRRLLPPIGLWTYNYWKPKADHKFATRLQKSISAPPITISDVNPDLRAQAIENELFNLGYFNATASASVDTIGKDLKKGRVNYHITLTPPFHYGQVRFDTLRDPVDKVIRESSFTDRIRSGDQFDLSTLKAARRDVSRELQNLGYFYFNPELIELSADTTITKGELDLIIGRNRTVPPSVYEIYNINSIRINLARSSQQDSVSGHFTMLGDLTIYSTEDFLKPGLIEKAVYFKTGGIYSYNAYEQTVKRLNNLGVFDYVRVEYEPDTTDAARNLLDVVIDANMADNITLDLEADLVNKSTGYAGPAVMVGVTHGNAFKGAEKVSLGLNGGFEWQWGKKKEAQLGTFSYELGLASGLTFPRILLPAGWLPESPLFIQQTSINLDLKLLNRTAYYRMASTMVNLSYTWGNKEKIQHSFSPLYINNVRLLSTTPDFDSVVNDNIYIRKSFEEQFIIGMRYGFTYDNTYIIRPNNIFWQAGVNTSGNLVDLLNGGKGEVSVNPSKLLNTIYSQFIKLTSDLRYYRNGRNQSLVLRLYAGLGFPYRNSTVLPYVEQFFSGGAYSIRGFTARYLGPGSYYEKKSGYIDQSGDIKLEGNMEYRFGLSKVVKGALFLETGNIWLINEDENRPGAKFGFDTFHRELAVGTGFGIRFDFNFFVLRTDFGFPLRNPYMTEGKNWLFGTGDIWSGMLFYLAIGYPF